jgi:ATP-dependent exoDNAse (exonuclease V) beta subunit
LNSPATLGAVLPEHALAPRAPARSVPTTALPAVPAAVPRSPVRPRPAPQRLSYSQLSDYAKCGYRFYLRRILRLPAVPPPPLEHEPAGHDPALDPRDRGTLVHMALEELDFAAPEPPDAPTVQRLAQRVGTELTDDDVHDVRELVAAFAGSPLCARLAAAPRVRREAAFAFALDQDGAGPLVSGFVDVVATESDGTVLVVDYKTDRLEEDPEALVEREYATQRLVYALAALRDGAERVEVSHCLLERPDEPVTITYAAADAPDLAGRLSGLATGIVEHDYPVTATPHRELCGECPGRAALCSWPESRTLIPLPPAPSPAASARRS